jgi:Patatin-like phospholipase
MALIQRIAQSLSRLADAHDVVVREHEVINGRRAVRFGFRKDITNPQLADDPKDYLEQGRFDTIGLALSGGGIRSAAYCLGVMQALAKQQIMKHVDYLSTVSGGGYIGIAASLNMARDGKNFPFVDAKDLKDTDALKVLRDRANYLRAGEIKSTLENVTIYVRGVVANLLFVLPALLLLAAFTLLCNPSWSAMRAPDVFGWQIPPNLLQRYTFGVTPYAVLFCLLLFAIWALAIGKIAAAGVNGSFLGAAKYFLPILAFVGFMELQPFLLLNLVFVDPKSAGWWTKNPNQLGPALPEMRLDAWAKWMIGLVTPMLTFIAFLSKSIGDMFKTGQGQTGWVAMLKQLFGSTVVWIAAGLLLPLFLWFCYFLLVYWGVQNAGCLGSVCPHFLWLTISQSTIWYFTVAVVMFCCSLLLEPNNNSPHRLYRDRLSRAFCEPLVNRSSIRPPAAKISDLDGNGPYNLINTTLNVQADEEVNQRGRNGEFFLFSPEFIGSPATQFAPTRIVEKDLLPELDLATAVAISGAAASSNMGSESIRPLRFTLAFFNVRLGYWFPNLSLLLGSKKKPAFMYFLKEITGSLTSRQSMLYLTDGGHLENLGVYELLRRRCKIVFAVDAEADPEMNFGALVKLQRYARIDFGIRIELKWSEIRNRSLAAQKGDGQASAGPHCAIGRIEYENSEPGIFVYIKSSVTGDENDYVRDYNRRFRSFPHENTADQFFSEEQFEVYRALGFHAAFGMLSGEDDVQVLAVNPAADAPPRLARLFGANAKAFGLADIRAILGKKLAPEVSAVAVQPAVSRSRVTRAKRSRPGAKKLRRRNPRR